MKHATDEFGRTRGWRLENALEELLRRPDKNGEEQLQLLKDQLLELNLQVRTTNLLMTFITEELDNNPQTGLKLVDELGELLQLEAAKRANLEVHEIATVRNKTWTSYKSDTTIKKRNSANVRDTYGQNGASSLLRSVCIP